MAEYLLKSAAVQCAADIAEDLSNEGFHAEASGAYAVWEWLRDFPAADVRPVKRGKWTLNKDGSGTCSECGFVQNSCWDLDNWDNFCHHCGADMREES